MPGFKGIGTKYVLEEAGARRRERLPVDIRENGKADIVFYFSEKVYHEQSLK